MKKIFLILLAFLFSSCSFKEYTIADCLNMNNHISFFKNEWNLLYHLDYSMNPGYYVFDCSPLETDTTFFHNDKDENFEYYFHYYMDLTLEFLNQDKTTEKYTFDQNYLFDFSKEYTWYWYVENLNAVSKDYKELSASELKNIQISDQVLILKDKETSYLHVVSWYC